MITYKRDIDKTYDLSIKTLLRSYNAKFVENNNNTDCIYLYALDQENLVGSLTVSYVWDWATINNIYYENRSILEHLIQKAWDYYKNKAVGTKLFTLDQEQLNHFLSVGFKHVNTIDYLDDKKFFFADLIHKEEKILNDYKIIQTFEPIEDYQNFVNLQLDIFNKKHNIPDLTEHFDMVVLSNNDCIGGIQSELYGKSLYVNRLVVHETFRKNDIGTELMNQLLEYAKVNHVEFIQLGTSGFQARGFYEKFGFKVFHTRTNSPRGYNNYSMIKYLK